MPLARVPWICMRRPVRYQVVLLCHTSCSIHRCIERVLYAIPPLSEKEMSEIIDRVRKLLALAKDKGASEHEAATAMAMASRLMMQHHIDHLDDDKEKAKAVFGSWCFIDYAEDWHKVIAASVAKLY